MIVRDLAGETAQFARSVLQTCSAAGMHFSTRKLVGIQAITCQYNIIATCRGPCGSHVRFLGEGAREGGKVRAVREGAALPSSASETPQQTNTTPPS